MIVSNFCKLASCWSGWCGAGGAGLAAQAGGGAACIGAATAASCHRAPNIASKQPTGAAPARPGEPAMFVLARQGWPGLVYVFTIGSRTSLGPPGLIRMAG